MIPKVQRQSNGNVYLAMCIIRDLSMHHTFVREFTECLCPRHDVFRFISTVASNTLPTVHIPWRTNAADPEILIFRYLQ